MEIDVVIPKNLEWLEENFHSKVFVIGIGIPDSDSIYSKIRCTPTLLTLPEISHYTFITPISISLSLSPWWDQLCYLYLPPQESQIRAPYPTLHYKQDWESSTTSPVIKTHFTNLTRTRANDLSHTDLSFTFISLYLSLMANRLMGLLVISPLPLSFSSIILLFLSSLLFPSPLIWVLAQSPISNRQL